jgi:hypothetical protein
MRYLVSSDLEDVEDADEIEELDKAGESNAPVEQP